MPLATDEEVNEQLLQSGPIRLACEVCDRDDYDGVRLFPGGWRDIGEVQSLRDAISVYEGREEAPPGYSALDWFTHLGTCPECIIAEELRYAGK